MHLGGLSFLVCTLGSDGRPFLRRAKSLAQMVQVAAAFGECPGSGGTGAQGTIWNTCHVLH